MIYVLNDLIAKCGDRARWSYFLQLKLHLVKEIYMYTYYCPIWNPGKTNQYDLLTAVPSIGEKMGLLNILISLPSNSTQPLYYTRSGTCSYFVTCVVSFIPKNLYSFTSNKSGFHFHVFLIRKNHNLFNDHYLNKTKNRKFKENIVLFIFTFISESFIQLSVKSEYKYVNSYYCRSERNTKGTAQFPYML